MIMFWGIVVTMALFIAALVIFVASLEEHGD